MPYDFDRIIDRKNTNSSKWDMVGELFSNDALPMWVADMDFPCPTPVIEALRNRLDHPVFGYYFPTDSLYDTIIQRMESRFGWRVNKEWIVFCPGVINGLYAALSVLTAKGDQVIMQPPVYYPFFETAANSGCQAVLNPLRLSGNTYTMDFDDLRRLFVNPRGFPVTSHRIKAIILSSPHNPVGRVWTRDELGELSDICLENGCAVISDEIHCDLMVSDRSHTVTASLSPEIQDNTITLMSASKTFNLPSLAASFAIIPNARWRERFLQVRKTQGAVNQMGLVAMEAAFRHGGEYLEELLGYIKGNMGFFSQSLEQMPGIKVIPAEGTYLSWVDMRGLGLDDPGLRDFMLHKAKIATDFGYVFGPGGAGFQRFNLACPRRTVEEAVSRLGEAVRQIG